MLRDCTKIRISSLPVAVNNFRIFSVSFPARKVFCAFKVHGRLIKITLGGKRSMTYPPVYNSK